MAKLNIGDKIYFITKSKIKKDNFFDIIYSKITDIIQDEINGGDLYIIKYGDEDIILDCNGTKGKNPICTLVMFKNKIKNCSIDVFINISKEISVSSNFYTTKQDVLDEYRGLLCTEIENVTRKLHILSKNIHDMKYYEYGAWSIPSTKEYIDEINNQEEKCCSDCCSTPTTNKVL